MSAVYPLSGSSPGSTETVKRSLSPVFVVFFLLPNHFLSPSSRLPLSISGCHSHLHSLPTPSFIHLSLSRCCFPFSTLFSRFAGKKGPRRHRRRGHAHADGSFRSKQTVLSVVASHLLPLNLLLLSSPPTCVLVDHQPVNCGSFVDQPNLPTGT